MDKSLSNAVLMTLILLVFEPWAWGTGNVLAQNVCLYANLLFIVYLLIPLVKKLYNYLNDRLVLWVLLWAIDMEVEKTLREQGDVHGK